MEVRIGQDHIAKANRLAQEGRVYRRAKVCPLALACQEATGQPDLYVSCRDVFRYYQGAWEATTYPISDNGADFIWRYDNDLPVEPTTVWVEGLEAEVVQGVRV